MNKVSTVKKNNTFVIMCSSFCFVLNITEEI